MHGEVENLVCVSLPTFSRNHLSMIVTWEKYHTCCSFHLTMWVYIYTRLVLHTMIVPRHILETCSVYTIYSQFSFPEPQVHYLTCRLCSHSLWMSCCLCSQSLGLSVWLCAQSLCLTFILLLNFAMMLVDFWLESHTYSQSLQWTSMHNIYDHRCFSVCLLCFSLPSCLLCLPLQ